MTRSLAVHLPTPHPKQLLFINSTAKRKVIRAGRRGGKTWGMVILAVQAFLSGRRVLYAAPTQEQVDTFWRLVKRSLEPLTETGIFYQNQTLHLVELPSTEQRIRAKTAWNADTLRGDYADLLILDEWQLMDEDAWELVGAPMLLDNNGDAVFIYTPPSLHSRSVSKASDPQHAAKMYKRARADTSGRWATFHFTSMDNPTISREALDEIAGDMTNLAYRMEILAEDVDEAPGALWTRATLERGRISHLPPLRRVVVAIDPSATSTGDEAGIIVAGEYLQDKVTQFCVLADLSIQGSPLTWAQAAVTAYHKYKANVIVAEVNNGGEMVEGTIRQAEGGRTVAYRCVHASRGKQTRAEPIAAIYEKGRGHHVGTFSALEDELCLWMPGDASPNRLDALVWAGTELMMGAGLPFGFVGLAEQKAVA